MKRFSFQLEPVLNFKDQQLDTLMTELSRLQGQVRAQENKRDEAQAALKGYDEECTRKKAEGMTILEALEAQTSQEVLARRLRREEEKLAELRKLLEAKRTQVVEARKEIHSLERLKEIRRDEYDKAAAKAEEKMLDDLTATKRAQARAGISA